MMSMMGGGGGFTAAQWVELEHQALIFKYIMAGVPVPPDLLHPIRSSFDAIQSPYYRHSSLGYYSYYGKKLDPEPWRCRRTDGKKWRCAKEAYPDSKYCERHMHRGRNRSRKPVESSSLSKTPLSSPSSSSLTTAPPPSSSSLLTSALNPTVARKFETFSPLNPSGNNGSHGGPTFSPTYINRCSNFSEPSGSPLAYGSIMNSSFPSCLDPVHEDQLGQVVTVSSFPKEHHKPSFVGFGFGEDGPVKVENPLRPFFDEWPVKSRGDTWADLEDERNNNINNINGGNNNRNNGNLSCFSTTRLSISIPMGSNGSSPDDD